MPLSPFAVSLSFLFDIFFDYASMTRAERRLFRQRRFRFRHCACCCRHFRRRCLFAAAADLHITRRYLPLMPLATRF
jgi:hypothetical protein